MEDVNRIGLQGFAGDQLVSLYRYYRRLTTPAGQPVSYSDAEVATLLSSRNKVFIPANQTILLRRSRLYGELALDRGFALQEGSAGPSVLPTGAPLIVTGHSLGGHLAMLFGRLFPGVTEHVYTYNAPGINSNGERNLRRLGIGPIDPTRLTNVASTLGSERISRIWSKPGVPVGVYTEPGSALYDHSIVPLTDALALYNTFSVLSPGLSSDAASVSRMISAATTRPEESLEITLDFLRRTLGIQSPPTLVARAIGDLDQREDYYRNLYGLLDQRTGGLDYEIVSLAGKTAGELAVMAKDDVSVRYALHELMPFAVRNADYSSFEDSFSAAWLASRAEMLATTLEGNLVDRAFGFSGTTDSVLFRDAGSGVRLAKLDGIQGNLAVQISGLADRDRLQQFLNDATYRQTVVFGSESTAEGDQITGLSGGDRLFGGAGGDVVNGGTGDDYMEGGAGDDALAGGEGDDTLDGGKGADRLEGGPGNDVYWLAALVEADTIIDRDGLVYVDGTVLTGGSGPEGGTYQSDDGRFSYAFSGDLSAAGTLIVNGALRVEGFRNGDLGIRLANTLEPGEVSLPGEEALLLGDYVYASVEISPGETVFRDPFGNPLPITRGAAAPDRQETVTDFPGTPGSTHYVLGGGNDQARDIHGGDDWIELGTGDDFGDGGDGDDLLEGGPGRDSLEGGPGNDVLIAGTIATFTEDLDDSAIAVLTVSGDQLLGGEGDDVIFGNAEANAIQGDGGRDRIFSGAGSDRIFADGGLVLDPSAGSVTRESDEIDAGAGNDVIFSFGGDDLIFGGDGNDLVEISGIGVATIFGGDGDDEISLLGQNSDGFDFVDAGPGDDTVISQAGNSVIVGGAGNDTLTTEADGDILHGGDGDDVLFARSAGSVLDGGAGNDKLGSANPGGGDVRIRWGRGSGFDFVNSSSGLVLVEATDLLPSEVSVSLEGFGPLVGMGGSPGGPGGVPGPGLVPPGIEFGIQGAEDRLRVSMPPVFGSNTLPGIADVRFEFADGTVWDRSDIDSLLLETEEPEPAFEIQGSDSGELLFGSTGPDNFSRNAGDDWLIGDAGDDLYRYALGDGFDTIEDIDQTPGNADVLRFAGGVSPGDIGVFATGADYVLTAGSGGVSLRGGRTPEGEIERVEFDDGTLWTAADLEARAEVLPGNRAPEMPASLGSLQVNPGNAVSFTVPQGAIEDPDRFDSLTHYAITADGERLPDWLSFDASSLTVAGTPAPGDAGTHELLIIAADSNGEAAFGSLTISVAGGEAPTLPSGAPAPPPATLVAAPAEVVVETPPAVAVAVSTESRITDSADSPPFSFSEPQFRVGVPLDPLYREMQERFDVLLQTGRANLGDRYAEAIREFEERRLQREEAPPQPPPSDEEVEAWNSAMHAWHERNPGFAETDSGNNDGAWSLGWGLAGGGERPLDAGPGAGMGPGLVNPYALPRFTGAGSAPALSEGLRDLR